LTDDDMNELAARAALLASLPPVENRVEVRRKLGVSARELAELVGVSRGYIHRFEKGQNVPKGDHLAALSNFYDAAEGRYIAV